MKKRITTIILAICMLACMITAFAADDIKEQSYEYEIAVIKGLGIMSEVAEGDFAPNDIVTRADIADVLSNFLDYGQIASGSGEWEFFGDKTKDEGLKTPPLPVENVFSDVNSSYWAYEQIEKVADYGLMNGTGNGNFSPDENASFNQIIKTVVKLLGYEAKATQLYGGYPKGYRRVALELKLTHGLSIAGDDNVTRGQLAYILYKALFTEVSIPSDISVDGNASYLHYYTTPGKTLLTEQLGVYVAKGILTDNGATSLEGASNVASNRLVVGGKTLNYTDSTRYAYNYIGRHVEAYYFKDGTDYENDLIYVNVSGKDTVVVVKASQKPVLSGNVLYYYDVEDDDKEKITLTDYKYVIYNGEALTSYTSDVVSIDTGTVTVIRDMCDYDILVIQDFESWYVNNVNSDDGTIYDKITGDSIEPSLYENLTVTDTSGAETDINKIAKGTVIDIARNGKTAHIVISDNVKKGTIEALEAGGEGTLVHIGGEAYEIATAYSDYAYRIDFAPGDEVTLYLNSDNKIIYSVEGSASDLDVGYIIKSVQNESGIDKYPETLLSDSSLNATAYKFADRINVSDETGEKHSVKNADFIKKFGSYTGIVRFKTNEEGKINYLEIPINDPETKKGGKLHLIYDSSSAFDENGKVTDKTKAYYKNNIFAGKAIVQSSTKTIVVNPNKRNSKEGYIHSTTNSPISNEQAHNMAVYTTVAGSYSAEYAVLTSATATAGDVDYYQNKKIAILKEITRGLNEQGEPATKLYVYDLSPNTPVEKAYYVRDDCKVNTAMGNPLDSSMQDGDLSRLGVGDMITWATDDEGNIKELRLIWDENGDNQASPISTGGTPGGFTGCYGYFDITRESEVANVMRPVSIPNPWGTISNDPQINYANSKDFTGGQARFIYGFPVDMSSGAVRLTTYDIVKNGFDSATLDMDLFKTEVWMPKSKTVVVNIKNGTATFKSGSILNEELRTYADYGEDCSRVINISSFATCWRFVVINDYTD